jgi:hypothetical protein
MMHNQLCEFSNRFPLVVADILERDRHKRRNFREESKTDLMMAGLIGLEAYGIKVDFPDEVSTGADMNWEFVSPHPVNGNRYLRLYNQAKRAIVTNSKKSPKWFYRELDHESPKGSGKGSQAQTIVKAAATAAACCPFYFFYHPRQALNSASGKLPAIDGVNAVMAHPVAKAVAGGCGISEKQVSHWRPHFMTLADILCWPAGVLLAPQARVPGAKMQFMRTFQFKAAFSPDRLAERLEAARRHCQTNVAWHVQRW